MKYFKDFELIIFYFLIAILVSYILIEIIELIYQFWHILLSEKNDSNLLISPEEIKKILPVFFSILIAVELIDTLRVYNTEHSIKVLNIYSIGMMAIGRKLLTYDFHHEDSLMTLGLAALILALSCGYYLVKISQKTENLN